MTNSTSSIMAIMFGLAVFAIIVAVGWRSVQNRRILRLKGANGEETIIVAREDDDISSVVTTTETIQQTAAPALDPSRGASKSETAVDVETTVVERDRLSRVVSSAQ